MNEGVANTGTTPEQMLFCRQTTANTASAAGVSMLSGMPVPSPVSHARQQADAMLAALQAKLDAAEAALAAAETEIARLGSPAPVAAGRSPFINALASWPGRGGVDQWSGMPLSAGRWVK